MTSILAMGLLFGMRHAFDADHIAAVAALSTRSRGPGEVLRLGLAWGTGHAVTLLVLGTAVLMLDADLSETAARALELFVGVMLVVLGADVLRRVLRQRVHLHVHRHGRRRHFHAHSHVGGPDHAASAHDHAHGLPRRALLVGLVHGAAGSAALLAVAVGAVGSPALGLAYVAVFGLGSVLGMAALSLAVALPLRFGARRLSWSLNGLTGAVGAITVGLGASMVWDTGIAPALGL